MRTLSAAARKRISLAQKKRWANHRKGNTNASYRNEKVTPIKSDSDFQKGVEVGYVLRSVEETINAFTDSPSSTLSGYELAGRVGSFLLTKAGREDVGLANHLQPMRRTPTKRSKAVEPVAVVGRPRSNKPLKRKRYSGKHWTQLPENRAKLMKTVRAMKRGYSRLTTKAA